MRYLAQQTTIAGQKVTIIPEEAVNEFLERVKKLETIENAYWHTPGCIDLIVNLADAKARQNLPEDRANIMYDSNMLDGKGWYPVEHLERIVKALDQEVRDPIYAGFGPFDIRAKRITAEVNGLLETFKAKNILTPRNY